MSWLSMQLERMRARLDERDDPRPEAIVLPDPSPETARAVVVSFYMGNIRRGVVEAQRAALARFLPEGVAVRQIRSKAKHGPAIDAFLASTTWDVVVVLDIDCIPTADGALERLIAGAEAGRVVGPAFRANHIGNGGHIFAGPFAFAVARKTWEKLGRPSFRATSRGDVGEEMTYEAEARGVETEFLWPVRSDDLVWDLRDGIRYGHGTTYEGGMWHAFEIRHRSHQAAFIERARAFVAAAGPKPTA